MHGLWVGLRVSVSVTTMQIFVRMLSRKVLTLEVEGTHTVDEVHDMIERVSVPRYIGFLTPTTWDEGLGNEVLVVQSVRCPAFSH